MIVNHYRRYTASDVVVLQQFAEDCENKGLVLELGGKNGYV